MLADRDRAGEGNLLDPLLGDQMLGDFRRHAEDEIEHAGRHAGVGEAAHQFDAAARSFFRGLDDDRAAGGERAGNLAHWGQSLEIPRREGRDHAARFLQHKLAYAFLPPGHDTAIGAAAFLGIPVDDVGGGQVFLDDFRAGDVARHEVGGELHPLKPEGQGLRHGVHHHRLGQAGYADQQGVPARQDGGEDPLDRFLLPHDAAGHLRAEPFGGGRQLLELFDIGGGGTGDGHCGSRSGSGGATGAQRGKLQDYLPGPVAYCDARQTHCPPAVRTQVSVQTT